MIDFIKLKLSCVSEDELLRNDFLSFNKIVDDNAELKYPYRSNYQNLRFKINPTRKELSGSLHRYYNLSTSGEDHNANDFDFSMVQYVIDDLEAKFGPILTAKIENLEFGMNIELDESPSMILSNKVLGFDFRSPAKRDDYRTKGYLLQFQNTVNSKVIYKIYDKGSQYERTDHTLRWETRITRNDQLKKFGIEVFQDLRKPETHKLLAKDLIDSYSKINMIDIDELRHINNSNEQSYLLKQTNPITCDGQNKNHNRATRKYHRDKTNSLIDKYGLNRTKTEIGNRLRVKAEQLISNVSHDLKDYRYQTFRTVSINVVCNTNNIRDKQKNRTCAVTGLDISHQKRQSKFVSETTLKEIRSNQPQLFDKLKRGFGCHKNVDSDKVCYYISHNIRNHFHNRKLRIESRKRNYEHSLFPLAMPN